MPGGVDCHGLSLPSTHWISFKHNSIQPVVFGFLPLSGSYRYIFTNQLYM